MLINGVPILDVPLIYGGSHRRPNIAMSIMHEDGVVPDYEVMETADAKGMTWDEFQALDWRERVRQIAYRRLSRLIEQHYLADASLNL